MKTRIDFLNKIKSLNIICQNNFSYKNGSDYYSIPYMFLHKSGNLFRETITMRVADHGKVTDHEKKTYILGQTDFRSYDDAMTHLDGILSETKIEDMYIVSDKLLNF